jgi:hypothetical protein
VKGGRLLLLVANTDKDRRRLRKGSSILAHSLHDRDVIASGSSWSHGIHRQEAAGDMNAGAQIMLSFKIRKYFVYSFTFSHISVVYFAHIYPPCSPSTIPQCVYPVFLSTSCALCVVDKPLNLVSAAHVCMHGETYTRA